MAKIRVLFVINDLSMPGGLATVTHQLCKDLQHDSIDVKGLTLANKHKHEFPEYVSYLGMNFLHGISPMKKAMWYFNARRRLEHYLSTSNFDVVIGVGSAMTMLLTSIHAKGYQVWGTEHSAYANVSVIRKWLKIMCYKRLKRLICLTESDAILYRRSLKQVVSIPNYTPYATTECHCNVKNKHLLYLGRFTKTKGSDYLVQIVQKFAEDNPDWKISLFGEGPERINVERQLFYLIDSGQLTVGDPIIDVQSEYARSSLLIMTSRNEGFPMVLLEAQAHGIPIVSFDCETGPSEIITNGKDGYLIPMFDTDTFNQVLASLAKEPDVRERMSKQAIINRKRFSREAIVNQWQKQFKIQL